jgi:hypothetical protein
MDRTILNKNSSIHDQDRAILGEDRTNHGLSIDYQSMIIDIPATRTNQGAFWNNSLETLLLFNLFHSAGFDTGPDNQRFAIHLSCKEWDLSLLPSLVARHLLVVINCKRSSFNISNIFHNFNSPKFF